MMMMMMMMIMMMMMMMMMIVIIGSWKLLVKLKSQLNSFNVARLSLPSMRQVLFTKTFNNL